MTNREKMLNSISNKQLAKLMEEYFECCVCDEKCPLSKTEKCSFNGFDLDSDDLSNAPECGPVLEKWLGETV